MQLKTFKLERYFAEHEFTARHLLSPSDCESMTVSDLVALADAETRGLWERLWLGYTESQGHPLLRQEIAALHEGLTGEDVLVAAPEEAIFVLMHALLEPGDEVILTWPAYQSLEEVARSLGCTVIRWQLRSAMAEWALDVDELPDLITPRTRLVIANFPHNPTGYLPNRATWDRILDIVGGRGVAFFSDEMYRWLEYDEAQRLPSACTVYDRAITLCGLSKSFGLPGLRIGWLATRDRGLLGRAGEIKDYTTICSSAPSEILAIMALRAREGILARNKDIVRSNLTLAQSWFAGDPDAFEWLPPMAGPVAFPRLRLPMSAIQFADRAVRERGVMIAPGEMFDFPGHFRVGLGRRNFAAALEAL
jgi:aspartate/methionine/tyrosine aminotransferase